MPWALPRLNWSPVTGGPGDKGEVSDVKGNRSTFLKRSGKVILITLAVLGILWGIYWVVDRYTHSITRDAFVDSHLINVSPQVSGTIVEMRVMAQEAVKKGQVLAVVDPSIYEHKAESAKAKLEVAAESLSRAKVTLDLMEKSVPLQIEIAKHTLSIAEDAATSAEDRVNMVARDVEKGITAATHSVTAAAAKLRMAEADYRRYEALSKAQSVPLRRFQEATRAYEVCQSEVKVAEAKLGMAKATRDEIRIARRDLNAARNAVSQARSEWELAKMGTIEIEASKLDVAEKVRRVAAARQDLALAEVNLAYTQILAPCDGVISKKWRHAGDYAHAGEPVFAMYNQDLLYVTVNLEETLLKGVHPGNEVRLDVVAFNGPFRGRVLWMGSTTDAKFSLIPRDVSAGEFTYVVQRVPVRIWIERDDRWHFLKPGLSVKASITHGPGDAKWVRETLLKQSVIEGLGTDTP